MLGAARVMTCAWAFSCAGAAMANEKTPPAEPPPLAAEAPMSAAEMGALSGGQSVNFEVLTRQQLNGSTTGNTINAGSLTSGDISFSQDSLNGFSGVGNFVINTGANNTLQGAVNISIVTTPGL